MTDASLLSYVKIKVESSSKSGANIGYGFYPCIKSHPQGIKMLMVGKKMV